MTLPIKVWKNISSEDLNELKVRFEKDVDSNRTLDKIKNLEDLANVLDKRDVLTVVSRNEFLLELDCHHCIDVKQKFYKIIYTEEVRTGTHPVGTNTFTYTACQKKVIDLIAEDIGQKWTDFARNLNIPEGIIDNLEAIHPSKDRIYKVLDHFRRNCDMRTFRTDLCNALEKARRKDLRKKVERIFDLYSN